MTDEQKQILLKVARDSIEAAVKGEKAIEAVSEDAKLNCVQGCFVTIKNKGNLRGCVGQFVSDKPLIKLIADMGKSSSTGDARFFSNPITAAELPELQIEISTLSPLEKTDDPGSLRVGIDGIYIKKGHMSGCFLPQVATETGWGASEFLSNCCAHKAGIEPDAWKKPGTDVYLFTTEVFSAAFSEIDRL